MANKDVEMKDAPAKAEGEVPKVKADDDPEAEGEFMRISQLRFRLTR